MSIEEKLSDLLDGTLSSHDEDTLFSDLASDKEIRNEFKQSLALEVGMHKEAAAIAPSSTLTNSLFTELGIGAGAAATTASIASSSSSSWLGTNLNLIISGLAGSIITALVFFGVGAFNKGMQQEEIVKSTISNSQAVQIELMEANTKSQNNYKQTNSASNNFIPPIKNYSNQVINTSNSEINNTNPLNNIGVNEISNQDEIEYVPKNSRSSLISFEQSTLSGNYSAESAYLYPTEKKNNVNLNLNTTFLDGFSLRLRKNGDLNNFANINTDQFTADPSGFANFSIAALYKYNDKKYVGIELRRESIFQEFNGTEEFLNQNLVNEGVRVKYYQMPSITTLNLFHHWDIIKFNNYSDLYLELGTGFNSNINFVGRASLGSKISFGEPYYLDFGLMMNGYNFGYQNNNGFFSGKLNFYGGLVIEL